MDPDLRRAAVGDRQLSPRPTTADAARAVVALHATDPASVYLAALARCPELTLADVTRELYDVGGLVRMMGMRRTLFVVPVDLAPVVHAAVALDVAAAMRRRLIKELTTLPTDPALPADVDGWLGEVEAATVAAAQQLGSATGAELSAAEPRLRTALLPVTTKGYDVRRTITPQVLTMLGTRGELVRGRPRGGWSSRQHTWQPITARWPGGLPQFDPATARTLLAEHYVRRFGPVTEGDLAWWTGWTKSATRTALAGLDLARAGDTVRLADDTAAAPPAPARAVLLPALDPTPMGWKQREWFLPPGAREQLYDAYGNIGPTIWWRGEVVGGWGVRADGEVVTGLLVDRGTAAARAVRQAAEAMIARLGGAVPVPSFRTPLERRLSGR